MASTSFDIAAAVAEANRAAGYTPTWPEIPRFLLLVNQPDFDHGELCDEFPRYTNHDLTEDQRLDDPRGGQAADINRGRD